MSMGSKASVQAQDRAVNPPKILVKMFAAQCGMHCARSFSSDEERSQVSEQLNDTNYHGLKGGFFLTGTSAAGYHQFSGVKRVVQAARSRTHWEPPKPRPHGHIPPAMN
jgi:hypothetical protein